MYGAKKISVAMWQCIPPYVPFACFRFSELLLARSEKKFQKSD